MVKQMVMQYICTFSFKNGFHHIEHESPMVSFRYHRKTKPSCL